MKKTESNFKSERNLNKKLLLTAVSTAVISVFVSFIIFYLVFLSDGKYLKLKQMDILVDRYFFGEVENSSLSDSIMSGYVAGLDDRFASYYDAETTKKRTESLEGKSSGIGIMVVKHPDTENIYIRNVYESSPAQKAGLIAGDQITAVDGVEVSKAGYTSSINAISGKIGDKRSLTIFRDGKYFDVTVECAELVAQSVYSSILDSQYAYIEITSFNSETPVQFENAVNQLISKGAKALIFDLRHNGGGTVDAVIEMVDYICPKGTIVTAKYANGKEKMLGSSDKNEVNLPMVVLTDGETASAAELFAASVRDFKKGILIGEKTFGKGVMQTTYMLGDGSSTSFTVAEIYPNSGESYNKVGIIPDIQVKLTDEERKYQLFNIKQNDPVVLSAEKYLKENEK